MKVSLQVEIKTGIPKYAERAASTVKAAVEALNGSIADTSFSVKLPPAESKAKEAKK